MHLKKTEIHNMKRLDITEALHPSVLSPEIRHLADLFVSPASAGRRYLFGRNEHSSALAYSLEIDGFVDDFSPVAVWQGKPVVKSADVPPCSIMVNCVFCTRPITVSNRIKELRMEGSLEYAELLAAFPECVPVPAFVSETRADVQRNRAKWDCLMDSLADDQSRQVLADVLKFRLSGDVKYMKSYAFRPQDQYFEPFIALPPGAVFVDAGGFDGDTTEEFCRRYPDYKKVFLFEPSVDNLQKAQSRLKNLRSIVFIEKGLSDVAGMLTFNPEAGSSSAVSDSGSVQIEVTTLDDEVREGVSFIKMDLEGWELKTLTGSRRHILDDCPNLAIAVYHHPSDFWRVFDFVMGVRPDYTVFLRHYTEGWAETVMFFVPMHRAQKTCGC